MERLSRLQSELASVVQENAGVLSAVAQSLQVRRSLRERRREREGSLPVLSLSARLPTANSKTSSRT